MHTHRHTHAYTQTHTQQHTVSALHKNFPLKAHVSVIRYARSTEVNFDKTLQKLIACVVLSLYKPKQGLKYIHFCTLIISSVHDQLMLSTLVAIEWVTAHIYPHVFNLSEVNTFFSINCTGRIAISYTVASWYCYKKLHDVLLPFSLSNMIILHYHR